MRKSKDFIAILGLALLMGALVFVIGVGGDFPLNDDWVYAWPVKQLVDGQGLSLLPYTGPLLYFQVLLGAGASAVFGFSFITLRLLTVVLGLVALWSLYWLIRQRHVNSIDAFLITAVLAFNPWFVNLSFTFMTDVPYLAFFLLSCALFVRGYKKRSRGGVALACVSAIASMFIRQIGALFFPAALLALFLARKKQRVRPLMRITFFFAALAAVGYVWLGFAGFLPETAGVHLLDNVTGMLTHAAWWWVYGVLYLGLFILPLFAAIALRRRRKFLGTTAIAWFIMAGIGVAAIWLLRGQYFPYVSNIINHQGLGPSGEVLQGVETAMFPLWIWWGVTALAAIGTAWFLQFYARRKWKFLRRRDSMSTSTFFIFASLGFQFLFVMLVSSFDRYWLPSLALALALVGMYYGENFKQRRVVLIVAVLAMGLYSVVGTQNYMRWNEVRWSEAETLVSQGVAAQQIEAGYEWCGWKLQEQSVGIENPHDRSKPWYVNSICPVNTAEYVISFSELEGREIIKKASYKSLYDTSPFLYVLKKDSP